MMGWSAATNGDLSHPGAWLLGTLLFTWQIPHFHALAAISAKDYAKGGYKMLAQVRGLRDAGLPFKVCFSGFHL